MTGHDLICFELRPILFSQFRSSRLGCVVLFLAMKQIRLDFG